MTKINGIDDQTAFTLSNIQDLVFKFLPSLCQSQQILSSYSGFIPMVSDPLKSLTKIVYYPVIQKPQSTARSKKFYDIQKLPRRLDNQLLSLPLI